MYIQGCQKYITEIRWLTTSTVIAHLASLACIVRHHPQAIAQLAPLTAVMGLQIATVGEAANDR